MARWTKTLSFALLVLGMLMPRGSEAAEKNRITMMVLPRRETAVQIGFDLARKYPVMLLTYQSEEAPDGPVFHAWDGSTWVFVSGEDYRSGSFVSHAPDRAIVVGQNGEKPASDLIPQPGFCAHVLLTDSAEPRKLLNFTGRAFNFSYPRWEWFARRYGFTIEDINPKRLRDRWYYHPLEENLKRRRAARPAAPKDKKGSAREESGELEPVAPVAPVEPVEPLEPIEPESDGGSDEEFEEWIIESPVNDPDNPIQSDPVAPAEVIRDAE
ncbi:hypothetical protein [Kiritimatiella glycovorans]|uniref:YHS domain protein n=1 Tax=Kiritimatiella glycovorans TaxID=1307763 RepID=A0A0G3ELE6_9BACT|nr:hypothetical protein [Kiritimatiella glycovorans]AKJ65595.1 hypothetical protein L21SP4_02369 [Kiritimatiella glycovorans]